MLARYAKTSATLVVVGKINADHRYLVAGVEEYLKRLRPYVECTVIEVPECKQTGNLSDEQIKAHEAPALIKYLQQAAYGIALSEGGSHLSSEAFAHHLANHHPAWNPLATGGNPAGQGLVFVVGGSVGLHASVLNQAHFVWSLSRLTFPHPMVRLLWAEQLYRACRILNQQPYHK
ncbi:MAG: 23S rRNA (pseudouridine(1915)-N(3))-methyltransferase RlmH [Vampirovibrionales bacterium]